MTFVSLVLIQFCKAYSYRSDRLSVFHRPFANQWLNLAVGWELLLLAVIVYVPWLEGPFGTFSFRLSEWLLVIGRRVHRRACHRDGEVGRASRRLEKSHDSSSPSVHSERGFMKAARLHAYGQPLQIDDIPTPQPGPGQVLVAVRGAGFCHSDIHVIDGEIPILPTDAARYWATKMPGSSRRQAPAFALTGRGRGRGVRRMGLRAMQHVHHRPRTALRYAGMGRLIHSRWRIRRIDLLVPHERDSIALSSLKPTHAAPLTPAVLTPYRAIKKALAFLEPDYHALVIGLGGLGYKTASSCSTCSPGAPSSSSTCPNRSFDWRGKWAQLTWLTGRGRDVAAEIRELTNGRGVSAAFDFVGTDTTLDLAVRSTRSLEKVSQIGLAGGIGATEAARE